MFNQFTINPAYAGSRDALSSVLLYRSQWTGLEDAPKTVNVSAHSPFHRKNMALGVNFMMDELGPSKIQSVQGTYAYHIKTNFGDFSMGVRSGIISVRNNQNELNFYNDQLYGNNTMVNTIIPNVDFGLYFFTDLFYAGASASHLLEDNFTLNNNQQDSLMSFELQRYFNVASGGVYEINKNILFKPSFMLKFSPLNPINFDINSSILFKKVLWVGFSYRSTKNLICLFELNITDQLRFGYSYDYDFSAVRTISSGSHEVFIGFDQLMNKKTPNVSPRFF